MGCNFCDDCADCNVDTCGAWEPTDRNGGYRRYYEDYGWFDDEPDDDDYDDGYDEDDSEETMKRCEKCGKEVDSAWLFCPWCAAELPRKCLNCGFNLDAAWEYCPKCGNGPSPSTRTKAFVSEVPKPSAYDDSDIPF